jgi:hypothetical protein
MYSVSIFIIVVMEQNKGKILTYILQNGRLLSQVAQNQLTGHVSPGGQFCHNMKYVFPVKQMR